jgi:hypothetical protein
MPRTAVPIGNMVMNGIQTPGTTAVDPANGHELAWGKTDHFVLEVNNTAGTAKNVTLKAGTDKSVAGQAGLGDLVLQVPNAARRRLGPFEKARFTQPDGKLYVDLEAGITGTIDAFLVP